VARFWVLIKVFIGKCYRFGIVIEIGYRGASTPGRDHPLLSHVMQILHNPNPSYPHPESKTYPQFAVNNLALLQLVFFFLCITQNRLYIMAVVGSRSGKTLGTDDFDGGGRGRSLIVKFDVPAEILKKGN
jgi:hypothetical protein